MKQLCRVSYEDGSDEEDESVDLMKEDLLAEVRMKLLNKGFHADHMQYMIPTLKDIFEYSLDSTHDWTQLLRLSDRHIAALSDDYQYLNECIGDDRKQDRIDSWEPDCGC